MISWKRTDQGGSVQTFIIVAVILTIVLIGAARYVQQHGVQVRRDQAIALANKQAADNQTAPSSGASTDNQGTTTAPGTSAAPVGATQSTSATVSTDSQSGAAALPTTGPGISSVIRMAMAGMLVGVSVAYLLSRRVA